MTYFAVYNMYMSCAFIRESTVRSYVHIKETSNEKGKKEKKKKDFLIRIDCCAFRWICVPTRPYVSRCIERGQFLLRPYLSMNNNKLCNTIFDICSDWYCVSLIQYVHTHPVCAYGLYRGMSWSGGGKKLRLLVYYKEQQESEGATSL